MLDASPAPRRAQNFPEATSFSISFFSVKSDTARRSRAFSASSSFMRFTWSTFSPPYSWRHLMGWTALPPVRQTVPAFNQKEIGYDD